MRILLVEDNQEIINFLKPSLEEAFFVIDVVKDGYQGSFLARTNNYDLIILDYKLPKKDGKQICIEIREAKKTTPILMLSVIADTKKKVEILNAGADDYLTKPFSLNELLARINALLRRPQEIEEDILKIDDLILDLKRNKVTRGKVEVYLTKKEYMLLKYLLRNHGLVLSRGMIMEHVWDINADPFSNTIEAHILSLRKKISLNRERKKLIYTVPGRGYKIDSIN